MSKQKLGERTICTHTGAVEDPIFRGAVSPIYLSTSYDFIDQDPKRYPRYFNTPNQEFLSKKVAALEDAEAGILTYMLSLIGKFRINFIANHDEVFFHGKFC